MPLVNILYKKLLFESLNENVFKEIISKIQVEIQKLWDSDGVMLDIEEVEIHVYEMSKLDIPGPAEFKVIINSNSLPDRAKNKKDNCTSLAQTVRNILDHHNIESRVVVSINLSDSWSVLL